ncbi:MAG: DNA repair and recombination protein RadB [Nanoarchaeota archaeon]|nr:DNA repair and recombination protein RadB [Nanoarchaeota archaeon]
MNTSLLTEELKISAGAPILDEFLNGGYEKGIITTIYGPSSSGKTNLCLVCLINFIKTTGKKVIYIDTESSFSVERFKQLDSDFRKTIEKIIFIRPTNFDEQMKAFEKLGKMTDEAKEPFGLVVVDSIAMLYRLEISKRQEEVYDVNRDMSMQLAYLNEVARKKNLPILITSQVYSSFEEKDKIKIVGGDLLKYGSKCLIELQKARNNIRKAILRKHRSLPEEREINFVIREDGIDDFKGKNN